MLASPYCCHVVGGNLLNLAQGPTLPIEPARSQAIERLLGIEQPREIHETGRFPVGGNGEQRWARACALERDQPLWESGPRGVPGALDEIGQPGHGCAGVEDVPQVEFNPVPRTNRRKQFRGLERVAAG